MSTRLLQCRLWLLAGWMLASCAPAGDHSSAEAVDKDVSASFDNAQFDFHNHIAGALRAKDLLQLASTSGNLAAGLNALDLQDTDADREVARQRLEATFIPHHTYYENLKVFRKAAFGADSEATTPVWLQPSMEYLVGTNGKRGAYILWSVSNHTMVVRAIKSNPSRYERLAPLLNVKRNFLSTDDNGQPSTSQKEEDVRFANSLDFYQKTEEAQGFNIVEPERLEQDDEEFVDHALGQIFAAWRRKLVSLAEAPLVLMVHAGEGYTTAPQASLPSTPPRPEVAGSYNVELYLQKTLEHIERENDACGNEKLPWKNFELIIAHAARIGAIRNVDALLKRLYQALDHRVVINVNPLSNLGYQVVTRLADIQAYRLNRQHLRLVVGTDNLGTLEENLEVHQLMLDGKANEAQVRAAGILQKLRNGDYEATVAEPTAPR